MRVPLVVKIRLSKVLRVLNIRRLAMAMDEHGEVVAVMGRVVQIAFWVGVCCLHTPRSSGLARWPCHLPLLFCV